MLFLAGFFSFMPRNTSLVTHPITTITIKCASIRTNWWLICSNSTVLRKEILNLKDHRGLTRNHIILSLPYMYVKMKCIKLYLKDWMTARQRNIVLNVISSLGCLYHRDNYYIQYTYMFVCRWMTVSKIYKYLCTTRYQSLVSCIHNQQNLTSLKVGAVPNKKRCIIAKVVLHVHE